ncbi:uncharacterized protein LOC119598966 [Penaeus monodon]|uniref:uncharacterized protein LOC119598966 n=1 Tax=Penaeus monodon TaxID=6687 RepID=UPI0018A7B678|nr:uncharacterized protein LOC119598966 [Penaeus monodon]
MSRERRVSVASSVVSDVSALPAISEDEIQGLSLEQLECATEELQGLCNTLQSELDLYTRYLNSQVAPEPAPPPPAAAGLSPASHSGSGTATPTISSLDVRGLWHGQVVTRGRREPRLKLSEKEKCQLWQRELEIVMANKRKKERLWYQELHKYQVRT